MNIYEINFYIQAQSTTHFRKHKQESSVAQRLRVPSFLHSFAHTTDLISVYL